MGRYPDTAVERAMKVQEVILRAIDGRLKWFEAAEILGVSCRTMRRLKLRYEHRGYDGLFDRRQRRPSPRRVALATVQRVLRLYREEYQGFNIRHFHELLKEEQGIELSYTWVKTALQAAGPGQQGPQAGPAPIAPRASASGGDDLLPTLPFACPIFRPLAVDFPPPRREN